MIFYVLLLGTVMGFYAGYQLKNVRRELRIVQLTAASDEQWVEIQRLREQVARLVGVES